MKVIVHKFCIGDVEDPDFLVTTFLTLELPTKELGQQLAEFRLDPTSYKLLHDDWHWQVEVYCDNADPKDVYMARLSGLTLQEIS
jgi:hypothetical protein